MEKPLRVNFSSGPCAKHTGWTPPSCKLVGRSHRSAESLGLIQKIIDLQRAILKIPEDHFVGIVSASSTGAMETLMWSLLGIRGVDVLVHCIFSNHWANDISNELRIDDFRAIQAKFPKISDVSQVNFDRDLVFCLSSTTSGVAFNDLNWIPNDRRGLVICDAASAVFNMDFDWNKLDAVSFSWQKGIGGEAGLGSIVLSPRAISRLESYKPNRPIPRIFRIANDRKVNFDLFKGCTINTPSMICIEDFYNNLLWANELGGLDGLTSKVEQNYAVVKKWINEQSDFAFLVDEKYRTHHIACLDIISSSYQTMSEEQRWLFLKKIVSICEKEEVGFDFLGHILAKPHLRIWAGPTIDASDLEKFFPWLEFAYKKSKLSDS
ncbi:MAG: phosphoserine transaminase [Holosporaceae bacterium]|jgi:phosphoserine aminotransferase|nr:phosphoserine transaminase [Holosporaceae bacterium]